MQFSLNGLWHCSLPDGRALEVTVPGCLERHIEEKDIGGVVTYSRTFTLDRTSAKHVLIRFDKVSYFCDVFVNDRPAGSHEGMWDAFHLDITALVHEGENSIRVEVTKPGYYDTDRFPLRQVLSGFIPDVLCTFGGIWGNVDILVLDGYFAEYHYAQGGGEGSFTITMGLCDLAKNDDPIAVSLTVRNAIGSVVCSTKEFVHAGEVTLKGRVSNAALWTSQSPELYTYDCELVRGIQAERLSGSFGFRELRAEGSRMFLGGSPVNWRGLLHWGLYDRDFTPTPSREQIDREIDGIRAYGFNAIKHCLYIPTDEYLSACDKAGILQWVELPLWLPEKTDALSERIRREYPRILRRLLSHPSVILYSLGCELDTAVEADVLSDMYNLVRGKTGALVCDNSGSGECYEGLKAGFADFFDYHFYADLHYMEPLMEAFTPTWRNNKPWLFGEFCDADSLRSLEQVRQRYGVERLQWERHDPHINPLTLLKPEFTSDQYDANTKASGISGQFDRLQALSIDHCLTHRKIMLEQTRAFPEISGYNITSLRDMPLSADGMFDDFGQPKFDIDAFRAANSDIVLTPAWDLTRIWMTSDRVQPKDRYSYFGGQSLGWHILISNFSAAALTNPVLEWTLSDGAAVLASGAVEGTQAVDAGQTLEGGAVRCALPEVTEPATCVLTVSLRGHAVKNQWPIFVYPSAQRFSGTVGVFDPAGVWAGLDRMYPTDIIDGDTVPSGVEAVAASYLSPALREWVKRGGRLLLCQRGTLGGLPAKPVCFWRESLIDHANRGFLGALPRNHFAEDLRYFGAAADTAFETDRFASSGFGDFTSLLTRYDARIWTRADYVTEIRHGKGQILATTLKLDGGAGKQPIGLANNVFSRWFIDSALSHLLDKQVL